MGFLVAQRGRAAFKSNRRVIDGLGDGNNNSGRPVTDARDDALGKGITINGLVILTPLSETFRPEHTHPEGGLEKYFQDNVIGGLWACTVGGGSQIEYGRAPRKRLFAGVAARPPPPAAAARSRPAGAAH